MILELLKAIVSRKKTLVLTINRRNQKFTQLKNICKTLETIRKDKTAFVQSENLIIDNLTTELQAMLNNQENKEKWIRFRFKHNEPY